MKTRYPPIAALRAFDAAARHLNYTKAAEELFITQSAVSHQIRHAEDIWGLKLFERRGRRLMLTEGGQTLLPVVRAFFDNVDNALAELSSDDQRKSLRVTLLQSFAFKWLVPRLGRFNQRQPDIDVWIATTEELIEFSVDNADIGIRLGRGGWPDLHVTPLLKEYVFPVCSPRFLDKFGTPGQPRDLLNYPLLRRSAVDICPRWRDWFRDAGIEIRRIPRGTKLPDTSLAIQAALDDQGIALARSAHVADDLAAGRLVKLFNILSESSVAYFVVCPSGTENRPAVKAFRDWLLEEAPTAQAEFDAVVADDRRVAAAH